MPRYARLGATVSATVQIVLWASAVAAYSEAATATDSASARIVVQHAPLAGFVYYGGKGVWDHMKRGDKLTLVREPSNPQDANAVRIEWQGRMLGYVPRRENADLARQLDHGATVEARVTELRRAVNGRHQISYEIAVPLK